MNKIYFGLVFAAALTACTTDSNFTSDDDARDESSFAKIDVVTGSLEDARDGKTYKTVQIKDQTWMAENLRFEAKGSSCSQEGENNCETDGRLYTWAAAMDSSETVPCGNKKVCDLADSTTQPKVKGVCPEGWHLPSDSEWDALIGATGDTEHAALALKSKNEWKSYPGVDQYQFNVIPTYSRSTDGSLSSLKTNALFWTSTEFVQTNSSGAYSNNACGRYFENQNFVEHRSFDKRTAHSVRCIKD